MNQLKFNQSNKCSCSYIGTNTVESEGDCWMSGFHTSGNVQKKES